MVAFRLHPYYMLFIQFCKPLVLIFKNLFISYCLQSTAKTYGFALYFDFVYLLFCINHGVKGGGGSAWRRTVSPGVFIAFLQRVSETVFQWRRHRQQHGADLAEKCGSIRIMSLVCDHIHHSLYRSSPHFDMLVLLAVACFAHKCNNIFDWSLSICFQIGE